MGKTSSVGEVGAGVEEVDGGRAMRESLPGEWPPRRGYAGREAKTIADSGIGCAGGVSRGILWGRLGAEGFSR